MLLHESIVLRTQRGVVGLLRLPLRLARLRRRDRHRLHLGRLTRIRRISIGEGSRSCGELRSCVLELGGEGLGGGLRLAGLLLQLADLTLLLRLPDAQTLALGQHSSNLFVFRRTQLALLRQARLELGQTSGRVAVGNGCSRARLLAPRRRLSRSRSRLVSVARPILVL